MKLNGPTLSDDVSKQQKHMWNALSRCTTGTATQPLLNALTTDGGHLIQIKRKRSQSTSSAAAAEGHLS